MSSQDSPYSAPPISLLGLQAHIAVPFFAMDTRPPVCVASTLLSELPPQPKVAVFMSDLGLLFWGRRYFREKRFTSVQYSSEWPLISKGKLRRKTKSSHREPEIEMSSPGTEVAKWGLIFSLF